MIVIHRLHVCLAASIITDTPSIMWPGMVCGCGWADGDVNAVSGQHHYPELCSAPAQCHSCRRRPAHRDTWRRGVALDTGHTGHRVTSSTVNIHNNTHHWYHKHSIQHDTQYIGILIVVKASLFIQIALKSPVSANIYSTHCKGKLHVSTFNST